ncbi:MAG TPA: hypothetical protein VFZ97_08490 [Acidimicrobiales bacterium]
MVLVLLPAAIAVAMAASRRFGAVGRLLFATVVGVAVGKLDSHLLLRHSHPETWPQFLAGQNGVFAVAFPPVAWFLGAAAILTVCGGEGRQQNCVKLPRN